MRKKAKKRFPPKKCSCGCGKTFIPIREWQIYKTDQCRKRAWASRASIDVESAIKNLGIRVLAIEKQLRSER